MSVKAPPAYRLLLLLLPPRFRRDFGPDLEAVLVERLRDAPSAAARAWIWLIALADVFTIAPAEWAHALRHQRMGDAPGSRNAMDHLKLDLRFALRSLARRPGFTAIAVITLALGIGANTTIFSLMDSVMMRSLPVEKPENLVLLRSQEPGEEPRSFTNPLWEAFRDQQDVFAGVLAWSDPQQFDLVQSGTVRSVEVLMVSGSYFSTLGITPALGRLIANADDQRGCAPVAVLSYDFWQSRFGRTDSDLGRELALAQRSFEVVGVAAPGFYGVEIGKKFDVAIPLCAAAHFDPRNIESRGRWWLSIMGRTNAEPELSLAQLQSRLDVLSPAIMEAAAADGDSARQQSLLQTRLVAKPAARGPSALRSRFGEPLRMLMAGVAIVLLIACANLASLQLARATTRSREVAIRSALGASRHRLVRELLTESILLSSIGAAIGVLLAGWGTGVLLRGLTTGRDPVFVDVSVDARVLAFTTGMAVVTALLMGLLPSLRATSASMMTAMRNRQMAASDAHTRFRTGKWIVGGQVALSLVLLIGGGLLLRSFVSLATLDPGFDRNDVILVNARPPRLTVDTVAPEVRVLTYERIAERLEAVPGVASVARSFVSPVGETNWLQPITADAPNAPTGDQALVLFNFVTPGYFTTLRTSQLAGRDFDDGDTRTSVPVAIVNETVARRFFPDIDALGRTFRIGRQETPVQIIGIVEDSKYESVRDPNPPVVFLPAAQAPQRGEAQEFLIRTSMPASAMIPAIQRAIVEVSRDVPLRIRTLADQMADELVQERLLATLAGSFGVLALLLAMVGLYGVLSYLVAHRLAEFGIRMALGADAASVLRLVMKDVLIILAGGLATGLAVAVVTVRFLQTMLFGLEPRDPVTLVTAVCLLTALALLAGYLPARRATRVDPMTALRAD